MKPPVNRVLSAAVDEIAAALEAPQFDAMLRTLVHLKLVVDVLERDWDTAVSDRVAEIDTLRALLTKVAAVVPDPLASGLQATLDEATPSDLKISTLDLARDRLLTAMADAESYLESAAGAAEDVHRLRIELHEFEHAYARRYAVRMPLVF